MAENDKTTPDETTLAMTYAFVALTKTLKNTGNLDMRQLFNHLKEASDRLERTGNIEAHKYITTTLGDYLRHL